MRKRTKIALAVAFVVAVALAAWEGLREHEREPVYQGRGLRAWLKEYQYFQGNPSGEDLRALVRPGTRANSFSASREAIRSMGTNGIPTLLKLLSKKDSALNARLIKLWEGHVMRVRWLPYRFRYPAWINNAACVQNNDAVCGFEALGDQGRQAVPALVEIFERNITPYSQDCAARAIVAVGPAASNAIPALLRSATNSDAGTRASAALALGYSEVEPGLVIPALVKALGDTDWLVRQRAAKGLGWRGVEARQASPALIALLKDTNSFVRGSALWALQQIDPIAAAKAGVNTNAPGK